MSLRGYSFALHLANQDADSRFIGVRLGRYCIKNNIPVVRVAEQFGVSRMTIYQWFTGQTQPRSSKVEKIEKYLAKTKT
jgi:transcriptional regulator with XRE-family HTH domain